MKGAIKIKTIDELQNELKILHEELAATEHIGKTSEIRHKRKYLKENIKYTIAKIISESKKG